MAQTAQKPRASSDGPRVYRQPPPRGRPFYDVGSGRRMILPAEGGGAVPYVESWEPFSARKALRRAGVRARTGTASAIRGADRAAARAPQGAARAVRRNVPELVPSSSPGSYGGLLIWAFASIVALALLSNALQGRGPAAVSRVLGLLGSGLERLVSPNDPLVPRGPKALPASSAASSSSPARSGASLSGTPRISSSPTKLNGVTLSGASLTGVKSGFLYALTLAAHAAGATLIDVTSAVRSADHNASVGGVPNSNHLTGDALDGRAYVPGTGWVPLGTLSTLALFGLRSGNAPGFFNGQPDPYHVDDAANQH